MEKVVKLNTVGLKKVVETVLNGVLESQKDILTNESYGEKRRSNNVLKIADKEFHNFAGLAKEDTGLGVDIFIDQCESYKEFKHPFWLYFRNSYGNENVFIPITINDKKVLFGNKKLNIYHKDIIGVIQFIDKYFNDLFKISKGDMDVFDLYKKIKTFSESLIERQVLLTEMSRLSNEMTGLPFDVWIGINNKHHWVGVKFAPNNSVKRSGDFPEMSVPDCEIVSKKEYEYWRAEYVRALIEANKEALIDLGHNPQKYTQICNNLTKIGSDLKPIDKEPEFYPVSVEKFGYTKVRNKDGKFNFIDNKGDVLFKNRWFDVANDFVKTQNGTIRAYTINNGVEGFLKINPVKWVPIN